MIKPLYVRVLQSKLDTFPVGVKFPYPYFEQLAWAEAHTIVAPTRLLIEVLFSDSQIMQIHLDLHQEMDRNIKDYILKIIRFAEQEAEASGLGDTVKDYLSVIIPRYRAINW